LPAENWSPIAVAHALAVSRFGCAWKFVNASWVVKPWRIESIDPFSRSAIFGSSASCSTRTVEKSKPLEAIFSQPLLRLSSAFATSLICLASAIRSGSARW
jgi:hypothetical protein